jgi:hypothetical protein
MKQKMFLYESKKKKKRNRVSITNSQIKKERKRNFIKKNKERKSLKEILFCL